MLFLFLSNKNELTFYETKNKNKLTIIDISWFSKIYTCIHAHTHTESSDFYGNDMMDTQRKERCYGVQTLWISNINCCVFNLTSLGRRAIRQSLSLSAYIHLFIGACMHMSVTMYLRSNEIRAVHDIQSTRYSSSHTEWKKRKTCTPM